MTGLGSLCWELRYQKCQPGNCDADGRCAEASLRPSENKLRLFFRDPRSSVSPDISNVAPG